MPDESSMSTLPRLIASSAFNVAVRRPFSGPRRPGWSFKAELIAETGRAVSKTMITHGHRWARRLVDGAPADRAVLATVQRQRVDLGAVRGEWFIPPGVSPQQPARAHGAVLHFHGGGYVIGSVHGAREFLARLATRAGLPVLSVDYRLAPEHPFPAAIEDVRAAHRWLVGAGQQPDRIVLVGDSAGGGLALSLLFALRDSGEALPRGAALICPWVELGGAAASYRTNAPYDIQLPSQVARWAMAYLGGAEAESPLVSPLRGDFSGLPPLLFHVGGAEIFLDDVTAAAHKAREAGVSVELEVYPDMFHAWHAFAAVLPEGARAIERVADFVRRRLDG